MKIVCENLMKRYVTGEDQRIDAVRNCSATFEGGKIACIMGVSGSGKSTFLEMLSLNLAPDAGKLFFDGKDVTCLSEKEQSRMRSRFIGYVPQSFGLIPILTARENIRLPSMIARESRTDYTALFEKLRIADCLDRLPEDLSGGQKQRVALARELSRHPTVFLADEPTSALDSENAAVMMEQILHLRENGSIVILTTHDARLCGYADAVYQMTDGLIKAV